MNSKNFIRSVKYLINPYLGINRNNLIIHCAHHKVGSVWFKNIFKRISKRYGLPFNINDASLIPKGRSLFIDDHSRIKFNRLNQPYKGSHMIRDPRDIVISGYHYHKWTKEKWANTKIGNLGKRIDKYWPLLPVNDIKKMTYKEYLNSLGTEDGIKAEMQGSAFLTIRDMIKFDYDNPNIFNFKYEDIIKDEKNMFIKIFTHYGFSQRAISNCVDIAMDFSFEKIANRKRGSIQKKSHLRSGKSQQWKEEFSAANKKYFKQLFGENLIHLGYEKDLEW